MCLLWAASDARAGAAGAAGDAAAATAVAVVADTLVVLGGRLPDPIAPRASALTTRVEIDRDTGARDAGEMLDAVAGLQVRRSGGVGASAVPSIRGSSAAQIRLFIDGMPLDDAQTGVVDLALLPVERFESVDVHRGAVPVGLGGIGGAGAIDFRTREGDAGLDLAAYAGSFGDRGGSASWGGTSVDGSRSGLILIHGRRADNDFEYTDPLGTFHETDDDTTAVRRNAWFREHGAWLTGSTEHGPLAVRSSVGFVRRDGGRPAVLGMESNHASVRYDRVDGRLRAGLRGDLLVLDLSAGRTREYLYDPEHEVDPLRTDVMHSSSRDLGARLHFSSTLWSGSRDAWCREVSLSAGLERRGQRYEAWHDGDPDPVPDRIVSTAFAQLDGQFFAGRLHVSPAWRWNRYRDRFPAAPLPSMPWLTAPEVVNERDNVAPSLGVVWEIRRDRLFFEAHAASARRSPTWIELFGHRGGIDGNRALRPEEIETVDAAISLRSPGGGFSGRAAVFRSETEETIIYFQNSPGTSMAMNAGAARTVGLELEAAARLPLRVRLAGNLTLQRARDRSGDPSYDGKALPYLPDRQGWLRLDAELGDWRPRVELTAVSSNYRDRYNTRLNNPEARVALNLSLSRRWTPVPMGALGPDAVLATELEIRNVTDDRTFDLEGFPLPGRSVHLAIRLQK